MNEKVYLTVPYQGIIRTSFAIDNDIDAYVDLNSYVWPFSIRGDGAMNVFRLRTVTKVCAIAHGPAHYYLNPCPLGQDLLLIWFEGSPQGYDGYLVHENQLVYTTPRF